MGDTENAIKYYKKYVSSYSASQEYYDDAYYQLATIYYENDRLQEAKDALRTLKATDPNSAYNRNEKVLAILKQ